MGDKSPKNNSKAKKQKANKKKVPVIQSVVPTTTTVQKPRSG